jgi:hypothetical protein
MEPGIEVITDIATIITALTFYQKKILNYNKE